jgi:hypothetical protein
MILHALSIIINELNTHLQTHYQTTAQATLGNLAEGFSNGSGGSGASRDALLFSIVNIKEEKTLKNIPNYVRNKETMTVAYQNPPVFLNFQLLLSATHINYTNALLMLSRAIQFFQHQNTFTQDNVSPASITTNAPQNPLDQLAVFRLVLDLYSPTMEEVNHLWGTLGGKQYPFVLYTLRMLDLQFKAIQHEDKLIDTVVNNILHKNP